MVISIKDTIKNFGVSLITLCAVLISTMFINYYLDVLEIEDLLSNPMQVAFYDAQVSVAKLLSIICGSILMATSVVMIIFYIKQYIDSHNKELGILKALGYSNFKIATNFWVFGLNVFVGTGIGFGIAYAIMGKFYEIQNEDSILPAFDFSFHPILLIAFVIAPAVVFALISVLFATLALNKPVIGMIKASFVSTLKKYKEDKKDRSFIVQMKSSTRSSNKLLVFFIMFASFCFAAIIQSSLAIQDYAGDMMGVMIIIIGSVLSATMMFISVSSVIKRNQTSIAMMKVFGYSDTECYHAVLGCYRPLSYIGFVVGTGYQYGLMRVMVEMVFGDYEGYEPYELDVVTVLIAFGIFIFVYEIAMVYFSQKLKKVSVKQLMLE